MSNNTLIIDPFNKKFAIDEDGYLCKRTYYRDGTSRPVDLGYLQQEERQ